MQAGFIKVASAVPTVQVADCKYNVEQIELLVEKCEKNNVEIVAFPELSLTGYTCQDLFRQNILLDSAETALLHLLEFSRDKDVIIIVGMPVMVGNLLLNCAAVLQKGQLLGLVPKTYLPNYSEFYEKRWFASSQDLRPTVIRFAGISILWTPTPPRNKLALAGADIIFNLSASDELIGKHDYLKSLLSQQSARTISAYVYSSCGYGESTQDVVYGGNALIYENGRKIAEGTRFSMDNQLVETQVDVEKLRAERADNTTYVNAQNPHELGALQIVEHLCQLVTAKDFKIERDVNPHAFIPTSDDMRSSCEEIFSIQVMGLAKRIVHTHSKRVVVGISGGLDSTLALLVCVRTFDKLKMPRKGIIGVTMPGFGTTDRTYNNAINLMKELNVDIREISIVKSVTQHFHDIGHEADIHDVTYENSQARERTQIRMDLSNQEGGLVIGTDLKST